MKLLLATQNEGKVARYRQLLSYLRPAVEPCTPLECGITPVVVDETGCNLADNAELKARAYAGQVKHPILANDVGLYVEGEGFVDAPKRIAFGDTPQHQLTQEVMTQLMLDFWKGIASKYGGTVDAAWIDAFVVLYPDGTLRTVETRREVILTNREHGPAHPQLPIHALYYSKATGKPSVQHTEADTRLEMQPLVEGLIEVLSGTLPHRSTYS